MINFTHDRVTPAQVRSLKDNEVFVFGSNCYGHHGGGAARFAMDHFGAIWGVGEGMQGQSYAISTMEGFEKIGPAVDRFVAYARQHKELLFLVTPIGCGIAGYSAREIAPLFAEAAALDNVFLPADFWQVLEEN